MYGFQADSVSGHYADSEGFLHDFECEALTIDLKPIFLVVQLCTQMFKKLTSLLTEVVIVM